MRRLKIGLLPLYIKLYDDNIPEMRPRVEAFMHSIVSKLGLFDVDVICPGVCRIKAEFSRALKMFENECVEAIITIHLAYSPSGESYEVLCDSSLPVVVLDTTPTFNMSHEQHPDEVLYNHGIHGVQDMCCVLKRNGKKYYIEAGHLENSDVINRTLAAVSGAVAARRFASSRVGLIGTPFAGMLDFQVSLTELTNRTGIIVQQFDFQNTKVYLESITESDLKEELNNDIDKFEIDPKLDSEAHKSSIISGLITRRFVHENMLDAFTVNFMDINKSTGFTCPPFLEACKAMAVGVGYAGEGDVLTAAFVAAMLSVCKDATFTEMFSPDWENNSILLSHSGEVNILSSNEKPRLVQISPLAFNDVGAFATINTHYKTGRVTLTNISPRKHGFAILFSKGDLLDTPAEDRLNDRIRGWFRPDSEDIAHFLQCYSMNGGTHHIVMLYGDAERMLSAFASEANMELIKI